MIGATHISSGSVVVPIENLSIADLQVLIDIKRLRERSSGETYRILVWLLDRMPRALAAEVAQELDEYHPDLVLERHFPEILLAKYGAASVQAFGYSASVAA